MIIFLQVDIAFIALQAWNNKTRLTVMQRERTHPLPGISSKILSDRKLCPISSLRRVLFEPVCKVSLYEGGKCPESSIPGLDSHI